MFYGSQTWNPVLIIAQIFTIQCIFYISFGLALWILVGPYASGKLMLVHFFGTTWISFHSFLGWMAILATAGNAIPTSIAILFVVERAKKCLDFAATVYILHLGVSCAFFGIPKSAAWWIANCTAFIVTALLSEWLCLRREMRDIPIGGSGSSTRKPAKKFSGALEGSELVPLGNLESTSNSSLNFNSRSGTTENSLLGRIKATIGVTRSKNPIKDNIRLAEEV